MTLFFVIEKRFSFSSIRPTSIFDHHHLHLGRHSSHTSSNNSLHTLVHCNYFTVGNILNRVVDYLYHSANATNAINTAANCGEAIGSSYDGSITEPPTAEINLRGRWLAHPTRDEHKSNHLFLPKTLTFYNSHPTGNRRSV
jgi:hypothetical protein